MLDITVTVEDIKDYIDIAIDAQTKPTQTRVEQLIRESIGVVTGACAAIGITSVDEILDPTSYMIIRKAVIFLVISEILLSRDRGTEVANGYRNQYKEMMAVLRARPQEVQQNNTVGVTQTVIVLPKTNFDNYASARNYNYRVGRLGR
jgi:hypothetical protein